MLLCALARRAGGRRRAMAGRWDGPQRRAWLRHYYSQRQKRLMTVRGGGGDAEMGTGWWGGVEVTGTERTRGAGGRNGALSLGTRDRGCRGCGDTEVMKSGTWLVGGGTETQSEGDGGTQMKHGDMKDAEVTGTQRTEDVGVVKWGMGAWE